MVHAIGLWQYLGKEFLHQAFHALSASFSGSLKAVEPLSCPAQKCLHEDSSELSDLSKELLGIKGWFSGILLLFFGLASALFFFTGVAVGVCATVCCRKNDARSSGGAPRRGGAGVLVQPPRR